MESDEKIEIDGILRLSILRITIQKQIESDPDINQIQFLLYQYARAKHIGKGIIIK
jgi:hypothetical protein